ncbi:MAG: hypothetical protein HC824_04815, partial [Synechococcales cyanobacterium RM1_1_8]|nr:hypothetical protein [Synechococcales cyanobacterium RM1_1_8]
PLEVAGGFAVLVRRVTGSFPAGLGNLDLTGDDAKLLGTMLDKYKDQHLLRLE